MEEEILKRKGEDPNGGRKTQSEAGQTETLKEKVKRIRKESKGEGQIQMEKERPKRRRKGPNRGGKKNISTCT